MLPNLSTLSLRCTPCGTVHARPPAPDICAICQDPLWGVEGDDEDNEGGDATKRVGRVDMPHDLEKEARTQLGNRAFNKLVEPNRLLAPPNEWRMRHEGGKPDQKVPIISLACDHWFHVSCIANWAGRHPNQPQCPDCRSATQPGGRIIDQDLRDMGMADLIPPPPAAPAPVVPPTVAEARGALDQARERERFEAHRQRNMRDETRQRERQQRERVLREENRLKSIARLRMVLARRATKHFDDKTKDVRQYERMEKRKETLPKQLVTRQNVVEKARSRVASNETRTRSEIKALEDDVVAQEDKLEETRKQMAEVNYYLMRHTKPVVTYVDVTLRNRGQAYLALAEANRVTSAEEAARAVDRVRDWLRLMLDQLSNFEPTWMTDDSYEKGAFFNRVVDTTVRPQRIVDQNDFTLALTEVDGGRWNGGGNYSYYVEFGQYRRQTYGTPFGLLSRGLWMIDPLVPIPGMETASGGRLVQWPPQPRGAVPIPDGVSLWLWSQANERWEPEGLVSPDYDDAAGISLSDLEAAALEAFDRFHANRHEQQHEQQLDAVSLSDLEAAALEVFDRFDANRHEQQHEQQLDMVERINQLLIRREVEGRDRRGRVHELMWRDFHDDLVRLRETYPAYPPSDELAAMRERAWLFLESAGQIDFWERLGGTEEEVRARVEDWYMGVVD